MSEKWFAVNSDDRRADGYIRVTDPTQDGRHPAVARVSRATCGYAEYQRRKRLIAAAPEMLEALREVCATLDMYRDGDEFSDPDGVINDILKNETHEKIASAISKAEGQP